MAKLLVRKKTCGHCQKRLPIKNFGICRARRDKRNFYCKACVIAKVSAHRETIRAMKKAQQESRQSRGLPEHKLSSARKPVSVLEHVKLAVEHGCKSRDEIYEEISKTTKLSWDDLGDALARLAFESHELRIVRIGNEREIRRAA